MPPPIDPDVLRRKIAAHARPVPGGAEAHAVAARGLERALKQAAAPFDGLGLVIGGVDPLAHTILEGATAALPEGGLVAVLEAEESGHRGLIALVPGLIDALVEVQTTGRVEQADLPERAVTRIDEALVRDFIDFTLSAHAQQTAGDPDRTWPERMSYGSRVRDRGMLSLLLAEGPYLSLTAELGFEGTARRARMVLVLPVGAVTARAVSDATRPEVDAAWSATRKAMLDGLPLPLEAVLMRVTRPLCQIEGLSVGDLIPFGSADLDAVTLETGSGRAITRGRLGQLGGQRALRLPGVSRAHAQESHANLLPSAAEPDSAPEHAADRDPG
mgnify:CR=1 FL=1